MSSLIDHINELKVSEAFTRQSVVFDEQYNSNAIIQYKRERVRKHVQQFLKNNSTILELNCGTGEDALFFARHGHQIHATDISREMISQLKTKLIHTKLKHNITTEVCSYTQLSKLQNKGPYDLIFSNFGGLNCTNSLSSALESFDGLLKPGGMVTVVVISKFCLWETLLIFKGKFKTATRRFFSDSGRKANVEGKNFKCWYYNPSYIKNNLKNFSVVGVEGLCTIVPPSYIDNFDKRFPRLFSYLKKKEDRLRGKWPWKYIGDYYILSLKKN